ncbi:hypothetical protein ACFL59_15555 [Planctomycetota bacterium]
MWCETRPDLLDEVDCEFLGHLQVKVDIGLDAITEESVLRMGKSSQPKAYLESFRCFCHEMARHGRDVKAYLVLDYPGETLETLRATVSAAEELVLELAKRHGASNLFLPTQRYKLYPGTPAYTRRAELERQYGTRFSNDGWWRGTGGDAGARSEASLPSRTLLVQGGLKGAASASQYILDLCQSHGTPNIKDECSYPNRTPRPHAETTFTALLEEHPRRFHALAVVLAQGIDVLEAPPHTYLYDLQAQHSTKLDDRGYELVATLLAAPCLAAGLERIADPDRQELALSLVPGLCEQGALDLRLRLPSMNAAGSTAATSTVIVALGPRTLRLTCAGGSPAASLLSALGESGYLESLRPLAVWAGQYAEFVIPPVETEGTHGRYGLAPEDRHEGKLDRIPGAYLGPPSISGGWPVLAIARRPDSLPRPAEWQLLGTLPEEEVVAFLDSLSPPLDGGRTTGC